MDLRVDGLSHWYGELEVLRDINLTIQQGEIVCVIGPSGCGKSTLLRLLGGLEKPSQGQVLQVGEPPAGSLNPLTYVFQDFALLPWRSVRQNIELALPTERQGDPLVDELLEVAGLSGLAAAYPERLSLGQERRVALLRAFAIGPDLLLMDEPFVSLDEPTARRLRALLLTVWAARPTTVLFVTHDLREAIELADRIVLLTPSPARVANDIPIDLPREPRGDEEALRALLARLCETHPELAALL